MTTCQTSNLLTPPFSQHSNLEEASLTNANTQQIDSHQNKETSTNTDHIIESNDDLNNSHILYPKIEPSTSEIDQQRGSVQSLVEDSNSGPLIPRYNLQDQNRVNKYTFSGRISEKWVDNRRRKKQ